MNGKEKNVSAGEIPVQLLTEESELRCKWLDVSGMRFTEPFFDETITKCQLKARAAGKTIDHVTPLNDMLDAAKKTEAVAPAVIIFHLSRCGSTLISQAFATSGRFTVLSEVPFLDEILRLPLQNSLIKEQEVNDLLDAALRLYGNKRNGTEEHLIVKTDCWHIFYYELLRRMFPETPFVLMYRDPAEVHRSLMKVPGIQIIPQLVDPRVFGLVSPDIYNPASYTSTILEKLLEKFIATVKTDNNVMLVNYKEGPATVVKKVLEFSGLNFNEVEWTTVNERLLFHSKKPGEAFTADPPADSPASLYNAMQLYGELEDLRLNQDFKDIQTQIKRNF